MHVRVQGATLLHVAALSGSLPSVQLLVERGLVVNAVNPQGGTPLRAAADAGQLEVVDYLLAHGADVSLRDAYGLLAIDYARQNHHDEVVERLHRAP